MTPSVAPSRVDAALVALCIAGFALALGMGYPGWMTADSFVHLEQARGGRYWDWQPPFNAWWWRQLERLHPGPLPVLVQNLALYWSAWLLLALGLRRRAGARALWLPLVAALPPVMFPLGQIWKDVAFACVVLHGWAVLYYIAATGRRAGGLALAWIALVGVVAPAIKPNGIVVVPFLAWYALDVAKPSVASGGRRAAIVAAATLAAWFASQSIVHESRVGRTFPFQYTQLYDLMGVSVRTGTPLLPAYAVRPGYASVETLARAYGPGGNDPYFYHLGAPLLAPDARARDDLAARWRSAILDHPGAYLAHRWSNTAALLQLPGTDAAPLPKPGIKDHVFGLRYEPTALATLYASIPPLAPWLFWPWLYAFPLLYALARARVAPDRAFTLTLALAAVAFALPHAFVAPASDYRYLYFSVLAGVVLGALTGLCGGGSSGPRGGASRSGSTGWS
jgi:hypothetical protein